MEVVFFLVGWFFFLSADICAYICKQSGDGNTGNNMAIENYSLTGNLWMKTNIKWIKSNPNSANQLSRND